MDRKADDTINLATGEAKDASPGADRFVYASGARPLEGYTIKRGVGQGGFGEIYFAVSDAGKEVALKLIRRNLDVELRGMKQCLNLKHPNLLGLFDIRQDDTGNTWVVMEYMAGDCLEDVLAARPEGISPEEALAWIHGIGTGVAYLHDHGIVHRDLKPGNIFCDEGIVKVGDYGLSKFVSCSRRSGHTESIGTVHYMAPEVANGRYGKELDIYALGIILYEMLTGRVPFDGESVGEVLMKHLTAKPDVSMLAQPYRSVIAKALEKDPQRRFRTVGEMLSALPPVFEGGWSSTVGVLSTSGTTGQSITAPPALAPAPREEPVWRTVRDTGRKLRGAWNEANLNTPVKVLLVVLLVLLLLGNAQWLIPGAFMLLMAYGFYRVGRAFFLLVTAGDRPPAPPPATTADFRAAGYGPVAAKMAAFGGRAVRPSSPVLAARSTRTRITELVGSLLVGALSAMAMTVVMVVVGSYQGLKLQPEQCAWLALVSIAGTWMVLVPAKFWEGIAGEPLLRRFLLMVVGLGLGMIAYLLAAALLVQVPLGPRHVPVSGYRLPSEFYDANRQPLAMAFMAVFGTLLAVVRWWKQADPFRASRLSLGSLIVSLVAAAIVAGVWQFPQPWVVVMVAGTMSVSLQLASPWVRPRDRLRPQNKTVI